MKAFVERGRNDRHQFRLTFVPKDAVELGDLRDVTHNLTRQMERRP